MKKVLCVFSVLCAIVMSFGLVGCKLNPSKMTDQELADILYERVMQRYMSEDSEYEFSNVEIYPLYDQNDKLTHFVIEFEPRGFIYVEINYNAEKEENLFIRDYYATKNCPWCRYTIGDSSKERPQVYELDENGELFYRYNSHYKEAKIIGEKRYLLWLAYLDNGPSRHKYIPAVKRGDKWLNLISMEEFTITNDEVKDQAEFDFFIAGLSASEYL